MRVTAAYTLALMSDAESRLDADAIIGACEGTRLAISHDPRDSKTKGDHSGWLEVIMDGMTFDVFGLSPAPLIPGIRSAYSFDIGEAVSPGHAAHTITPGPHLSGAERTMPVIRGMMQVARILSDAAGIAAVAWTPASSVMGVSYFKTVVDAWLGGGPFPALGLASLKGVFDGGLQSEGLAYFIGQELRVEPDVSADRVAATQLAARVINLLIETGPIKTAISVTGPTGARLSLAPSSNGRFARLSAG